MRSFLTMLGIIIGVGAVIIMLAIGQGAEYSVQQQITALGTNVLMVFPGTQQTGGMQGGCGLGPDAYGRRCPGNPAGKPPCGPRLPRDRSR